MDLEISFITAAVQLIIIFGYMRLAYGCWPWERHKTWHATKPRDPVIPVIPEVQKIALVTDTDSDTFDRTRGPTVPPQGETE